MRLEKIQIIFVIGTAELPKGFAAVASYRSMLIIFDSDLDNRVFLFAKKHYEDLIPCVKALYETHGNLTLYLHKEPNKFVSDLIAYGAQSPTEENDSWSVDLVDITK